MANVSWFGQIDSRPLSLFRIGFGALLLKQTLYLMPVAYLFYSDEGIVPRVQFWDNPSGVGLGQFSLLNCIGASWEAQLFFGVWAAIALALLVGYHTRLMAILNYLCWLSLLHRNPFVLHAPDHVMTVLSFWIIFLPLDQHYTLANFLGCCRHRRSGRPSLLPTGAAHLAAYAFPMRVIQIQVALIYLFTSYYKWQGLFWRTGDALFYTLQRESFLLPVGVWLGATAPLWLLHLLTWATLLVEASFALLVFAPVLQPWAKATGLLLATLLHVGIGLTMAIPDFSLVMLVTYLLFLEPAWAQWLEGQGRRLARLPSVAPISTNAWSPCHTQPLPWRRAAVTTLLALLLIATIWGGLAPVNNVWNKGGLSQPQLIQTINQQLHLASPWTMFAYYARPRDGWLLIQGRLANGVQPLLYTSRVSSTWQNAWLWGPGARLRMFEQRLLWSFPDTILQAWGAYYCRHYNHDAGQRLATVAIYRRYRWAHEPGTLPNPMETDLLWRQQC